jgi:three-Cys-motif partner protein
VRLPETPSKILWDCAPRTKAKLAIVNAYLGAWFGILAAKGFKHVIYIDGFCGPGKYKTGEDGSPVIAARMASATAAKYPSFKATLILVDEKKKVLEHLKGLDAIKKPHPNVEILIMHGVFAEKIDTIVAYLKEHPNSPTFSFVDPFGFGQSPFDKFRHLMHNQNSEIFMNLMCGFMNRFKEHEDVSVIAKIKAILNLDDLGPIIEAADPIDALCNAFERSLRDIGKFTLKFMMRDEMNIRDNAVFFCGRNSKGFEKIKEAMWKVDPENGNSFSARRDAHAKVQTTLFDANAQTNRLGTLLLDCFKGKANVSVTEIFEWVTESTDVFLPTHARKELEYLLSKGRISYKDPSGSARKRRANEWPERLLISFA